MKECCGQEHCKNECLHECIPGQKGCHEDVHAGSSMSEKAQLFIELADCAWMEVLKDKIKEYIAKSDDAHLTELAQIIALANKKRWKHKMDKNRCCQEFEGQLCDFYSKSNK